MKFFYPHWIHLCIVSLAIAAVLICHLYIDPACGRVWYHTDRWRRMVREDSTGGASGITDGDGPESCTQTICDIAWLLSGISLWTPLGSPSTYCDHLRRGLWDSGLLRFHPGVCSTRWVSPIITIFIYLYIKYLEIAGDLTSNVTDSGVGEVYSKRVAKQLASAIDYMHSK